MTEEQALEDAKNDFSEKFPCFKDESIGRADSCPYFIYTIYDQALGKNGIYKFI